MTTLAPPRPEAKRSLEIRSDRKYDCVEFYMDHFPSESIMERVLNVL